LSQTASRRAVMVELSVSATLKAARGPREDERRHSLPAAFFNSSASTFDELLLELENLHAE
jgi:hypothetical protein